MLSTDNIYQNRYELIPAELKAVPNWVMFRLEHRVNQLKPAKVPYQPSGDHAKANDPTTWNTFETCLQVVGKFDGIGFEFAPPSSFSSSLIVRKIETERWFCVSGVFWPL